MVENSISDSPPVFEGWQKYLCLILLKSEPVCRILMPDRVREGKEGIRRTYLATALSMVVMTPLCSLAWLRVEGVAAWLSKPPPATSVIYSFFLKEKPPLLPPQVNGLGGFPLRCNPP